MSRSRGSSPDARRTASGSNSTRRCRASASSVELMTPQPGLPDLVFTANAGLVFNERFFSSQFPARGPGSRGAAFRCLVCRPTASKWNTCPKACSSRGPAMPSSAARRCLPAIASAATCAAISTSATLLHARCCPLELVNPLFYHLDTCFCPLAPGRPSTIPERSTVMASRCWKRTSRSCWRSTSRKRTRFGCNAVVVGKTVITTAGCERLAADLQSLGLHDRWRGAGRVPQGRRQRQVPDAPAGWRGSSHLGVNGRLQSVGFLSTLTFRPFIPANRSRRTALLSRPDGSGEPSYYRWAEFPEKGRSRRTPVESAAYWRLTRFR